MEKKTNKKFLYIYVLKVQDKTPDRCAFSQQIYLSPSPMRYTQVSVCSNEEHNSSIYTLFVTWLLT